MRRSPAIPRDTDAPMLREAQSLSQILKIRERTHQLCLGAKLLTNRTEQLLNASQRMQRICNELLRDAEMLTARMKTRARGTRSTGQRSTGG